MKKALEIISHWEILKKLIKREDVYADRKVAEIDIFIKENCLNELNGKSIN